MGAIGGGIWHGIKGARNSPKVSFCERSERPSSSHLAFRALLAGRGSQWRLRGSSQALQWGLKLTIPGRASRRFAVCH